MPTETARLRKLYQMELLDTPAEQDFDEIVQLASQLAQTPISLITLLDTDRQWFKAKVGLDVPNTDRSSAVCNYTIQGDALFEVEDLSADRRFERNALVEGKLKLRYYAGLPLVTSDGYKLGALCVLDTRSRSKLKEEQVFALRVLARQAMNQIELRVKNKELAAMKNIADKLVGAISNDSERAVDRLKEIIQRINSHTLSGDELHQAILGLQSTLTATGQSFANVIAWSKLHAVYSANQPGFTDLRPLVDQCMAKYVAQAEAKGNHINVEVPLGATLPISSDVVQFIIRNLLENAIRFTVSGQITIRYFTSGGGLDSSPRHYLCIADTGIGIPDAYVQLFAERGEIPARPDTDGRIGHGHGLVLIRQVLHHLGGKMHIESSTGNHTNVIVVI